MNFEQYFSELKETSNSQAEYCYALLALHVKNCEKISKAIEEHGSKELQEAVARPYAIDEHVLDKLIGEMGDLVKG
jgi:hypothetical protein